jgi:hypothetical protein
MDNLELPVTGVFSYSELSASFAVGPPAPLIVSTIPEHLKWPVRYISLRGDSSEAAEVTVLDKPMALLRFVALTKLARADRLLTGEIAQREPGTPILSLPMGVGFRESHGAKASSFESCLSYFLSGNTAEIQMGGSVSFDRCIGLGDVDFLVSKGALAGIRVTNLEDDEVARLARLLAR